MVVVGVDLVGDGDLQVAVGALRGAVSGFVSFIRGWMWLAARARENKKCLKIRRKIKRMLDISGMQREQKKDKTN